MDNLKIAHEYLRDIIKASGGNIDVVEMPEAAWKLADAMQAEADKREKIKLSNKSIETVLNADLSQPMCLEGVSEWQPDWSQAPSGALSYHIELDELDGSIQPFWTDSLETHFDGEMFVGYKCAWNAPSFNYDGNWQDSLRKRPSNI